LYQLPPSLDGEYLKWKKYSALAKIRAKMWLKPKKWAVLHHPPSKDGGK
jgi:hypothetical protein